MNLDLPTPYIWNIWHTEDLLTLHLNYWKCTYTVYKPDTITLCLCCNHTSLLFHIILLGYRVIQLKWHNLWPPDRRHPMKWDRCHFSHYIWIFWYIVAKNSNRFQIFFTDWCVGGLLFWILVKIHWKIRIKEASAVFCKYLRNESTDLH